MTKVSSRKQWLRRGILSSVAVIALTPALAHAQADTNEAPADERTNADEIVVTGSLIRGVAPVGSNLIAVGQEELQSTAATTANELLATLPQVTNYFNKVPAADLAIAVNQIQISRPNIRNISPNNAASSATLILFDGHRIATAGTKQASVDPDVIPAGAIERVDVVTEGGSATYGADAVAGVINFITRKRFDGAKVDARYGFADDYWQFDANATLGKDWGSGSAYVSYTYTKNDALFGRDRDFIRGLAYTTQPYVPLGRQCAVPTIRFANPAQTFSVEDRTRQGLNTCDLTDNASTIPEAERHGVVASLYQELSPSTTIEAKAFYSQRKTTAYSTYGGTVAITSASPFYLQVPSRPGANQTIDFSFSPALGVGTQEARTLLQEWGANAELRQTLGENWQVRGLFNFSRSNTQYNNGGVSTARLTAAVAAGTLNPYNIATASPALLSDITDFEGAAQAKDELFNVRLIADGRLFALPGGDVRLALGYEYMHDRLALREAATIRHGGLATVPYNVYGRSVNSLFGELNIPIFGPDNAVGGIQSLVIAASGRYDRYSDFGNTFNPKIGVTYKPVEWLSLRGNWGTSFTAPTPLDQLGSRTSQFGYFAFAPFIRREDRAAGLNATSGGTLVLQGSQQNLQPQTAQTWSLGFDIAPPSSGFRASLSYYNVSFEDIIATPTTDDGIFINFPNNVVTSTTSGVPFNEAYVRNLLSPGQLGFGALGAQQAVDNAIIGINGGRPLYAVVDFRTGNFGIVKVKGLDFSASYRTEVGFGSLDLSVNGNYVLSRQAQASPGAPLVDELSGDPTRAVDGRPKLYSQVMLGANISHLRVQATWNHTAGYRIPPTVTVPVQDRVGAFDTVNLFFKYDIPGDSIWSKNLSLTLNVNNVLDKDPPVLLRNNQNENGYVNGFTFGRMFVFGVSKQF